MPARFLILLGTKLRTGSGFLRTSDNGITVAEYEEVMATEAEFLRLVDGAPKVSCPGCLVDMIVRTLVPGRMPEQYEATYRCPGCGTETIRHFKCSP